MVNDCRGSGGACCEEPPPPRPCRAAAATRARDRLSPGRAERAGEGGVCHSGWTARSGRERCAVTHGLYVVGSGSGARSRTRGPGAAADEPRPLERTPRSPYSPVPSSPGRELRGDGGKEHGKGAAEELQQNQQMKKALFGALYTLAKEKISDSAKMAYLTIFIDFILICCLFLMPEYPWAANPHHPCGAAPLRGGGLAPRCRCPACARVRACVCVRNGHTACVCAMYTLPTDGQRPIHQPPKGYSSSSSTLSSTCLSRTRWVWAALVVPDRWQQGLDLRCQTHRGCPRPGCTSPRMPLPLRTLSFREEWVHLAPSRPRCLPPPPPPGLQVLPDILLRAGGHAVRCHRHLHLGGLVLQERLLSVPVAHQGRAHRGQRVCEHVLHRVSQHIPDSHAVPASHERGRCPPLGPPHLPPGWVPSAGGEGLV